MSTKDEPAEVSASDLKNSWHESLERVSRARQEIVVTRYGRPVARLIPYERSEAGGGIFGSLSGSVMVVGDIISPVSEPWDADA